MVDRRRRQKWRVVAALLWVAAVASCNGSTKQGQPVVSLGDSQSEVAGDTYVDPDRIGTIDGSITYTQRMALPKGAIVSVELFEISPGGSPASPIARRSFPAESQVPIRFQLSYDRTRVDPTQRYAVRARILVDGALWFINDRVEPVLTYGSPSSLQIVVRPASARGQANPGNDLYAVTAAT